MVVVWAMVGILPFFIGMGLLGNCIFWETNRFKDVSTSLFTNFALMHGDAVGDTWNDMSGAEYVIGNIYCYIWISFAICVINNVFIVIIEDGYVRSKYY